MPMRFPYLKAARFKLQERKNTCLRADYESAAQYTGQFLSFIKSDPVVRATGSASAAAELTGRRFCLQIATERQIVTLPLSHFHPEHHGTATRPKHWQSQWHTT
jgi:hypothetical protein